MGKNTEMIDHIDELEDCIQQLRDELDLADGQLYDTENECRRLEEMVIWMGNALTAAYAEIFDLRVNLTFECAKLTVLASDRDWLRDRLAQTSAALMYLYNDPLGLAEAVLHLEDNDSMANIAIRELLSLLEEGEMEHRTPRDRHRASHTSDATNRRLMKRIRHLEADNARLRRELNGEPCSNTPRTKGTLRSPKMTPKVARAIRRRADKQAKHRAQEREAKLQMAGYIPKAFGEPIKYFPPTLFAA